MNTATDFSSSRPQRLSLGVPLFLAAIGFSHPAIAQATESTVSKATLTLRVLAVGQPVPPRFERSRIDANKVTQEGETGGSKARSGTIDVPLQIPREKNESPPGPLYVKNEGEWTPVILQENVPSPKITLAHSRSVTLATRRDTTTSDGKIESTYQNFQSFPVAEGQDSMLVLLIKNPAKPLVWDLARTIAVDTSWAKVPAGSISVFNAVGLPLRGQIHKEIIHSLPSFEFITVQSGTGGPDATPYLFEAQKPGGSWHRFVTTGTTTGPNGRVILIPYGVYEPATDRFANLVMIRDTLPAVQPISKSGP